MSNIINKTILFSGFLILALGFLCISYYNNYNELNEFNDYVIGKYESLHYDYNQLSLKYNNLLFEEVELDDYLIEKIDFINISQEWFSYNSKLQDDSIVDMLAKECINPEYVSDTDFCYIDLLCIARQNTRMGLVYKEDSVILDNEDHLKSVNEFFNENGGDCEDFSLTFVAEYNSLKEYCNKPIRTIVYDDETDYYYIDFSNMMMVCGYDASYSFGHCQVALLDEPFSNYSDLVGGVSIEPQDGMRANNIDSNLWFVGSDGNYFFIEKVLFEDNYWNVYNDEWVDYESVKQDLVGVLND
jgi:hypothetical protein